MPPDTSRSTASYASCSEEYARQTVGMCGPFDGAGGGAGRRRVRLVSDRRAAFQPGSSRNGGDPRPTGSVMQLMTTAAPRVARGALDGFDTVTLAAGNLEAAFAPGA